MKKYMNRSLQTSLMLSLAVTFTQCNSFIDIEPPTTQISSGSVYKEDGMAAAVLTSLYMDQTMADADNSRMIRGLGFRCGMLADELTLSYVSEANEVYYRNLLSPIRYTPEYWMGLYSDIAKVNLAIEGLETSQTLTPAVKQQLLGEARFMRAFYFYYLVKLYGDVPLPITTDYQVNNLLTRTPLAEVQTQIIEDLKMAKAELSEQFLDGSVSNPYAERVRPTRWAAIAMLARVYLDRSEYALAEAEASLIINNTGTFEMEPLDNTFKIESREAIWQLQSTGNGGNVNPKEGRIYILPKTGPGIHFPVHLSSFLMNAFETGDQRKVKWTGSVTANGTEFHYAYKYKMKVDTTVSRQENFAVLRLAEQYLIRAEARARQENIDGAAADLLKVRERAGLGPVSATNRTDMLNAVLHERQVELFTEWGHRWFDLKRMGKLDEVMTAVAPSKSTTWRPEWSLFPIPAASILKSPGLQGKQNPGYAD